MPKTVRLDRATQAAEGLPRWRWTTAELVRLTELGAFAAEDRFELIGGEIVPMSPMGRRHQVIGEVLEEYLRARCSSDLRVVAQRQLNLSSDTYVEPDILLRPATVFTADLTGTEVLLVIEIAASGRAYDLGLKAALYARHGVREYWVVDAETLAVTVHTKPAADGYGSVTIVARDDVLSATLVPALSIRLGDLPLD